MKSPHSSVRGSLVRAAFLIGCLCTPASALETAGSLLIDLDSADYNLIEGLWPQHSLTGIQGSFAKQPTGTPQLENVGGRSALVLDGDGDFLTGPLTTSALHAAGANYSVEYWAFQGQIRPEETIISWSSRGGPDGTHAAFRYGSAGAGAVGRWGGPDMGYVAPHAGGPAVGQWHHIVATYDGTTQKLYVDGVLNAQEASTLDSKDSTPIYIGTERNNDATFTDSGRVRQFSGALSKIRIHSAAMTATQVTANYNAELPQHPGITTTALAHPPVNRWSFSEAAAAAPEGTVVKDSMGGLNAVVRGTGASFTGTGITLPGGAPATLPGYVDLPNGLISSKQRVSFEVWVTQASMQSGSRMVVFSKSNVGEINQAGNVPAFNGAESIALHANQGTNNHMRLERVGGTNPNGGNNRQSENATIFNTKMHYVVVYDPDLKEWRSYRNGFLMEVLPETQGPSTIGDVNSWLGRSDYGADSGFAGTFDEFRIYNYTLSESEIRGNTVAGPDTLTSAAVQPFAWTPTGGGTYAFNNAGGQENWGAGNPFPDAAGSFANLVTNLTGDQTVELNTTATVGNLSFGDADGSHKFTIAAGTGGVLEMNGGPGVNATLSQTATSAANVISAPIQFSAFTELTNTSSTAPLTLSGTLTGTAGFSKSGGLVQLTGNNGSYTGTIAVQGGVLSIGDGGTSGTIHGGPVTINDEGVLAFNRSDANTVNPTASGAGTVRFDGSGAVTHTGNLGTAIVQLSGTGQVTNAGTINPTGSLVVDPVSSLVNHSPLTVGTFANINGEFVMDQPTTFTVGSDLNVGDRVAGFSTLKISDGTLNATAIFAAKNVGTSGVIVQTGGVVNDVTGGSDCQIGGINNESKDAWGAYRMTGGVLNSTNHFQVGSHGIGVMEVAAGTVNFNGGFPSIGRYRNATGDPYGRGVLDIRGTGVVNQTVFNNRINIGEKGTGTLNIRDGGFMNLTGGLVVGAGGSADPGDGTVNLLPGGTLLTQVVAQGAGGAGGPGMGRFNFHGGTLRARGNQPGTNASQFMSGIDHAYIHAGGAVIDTNGFTVSSGQLLEDPTGNGVTTIPVINGGSGYLAAPYLQIAGDGSGATAFANLTNGSVTSITITNPGTDYTVAPTVTALGGGAGTGLQLGTPVIAPNAAGGSLTKIGSGTLSLESSNLYTGPTKVEAGTLLINGDHGLATGKITVAAGATLGGMGYLGSNVEVSGSINPGTQNTGTTCGTLVVAEGVSFKEGSSYVVDIDDLQFPTSDTLMVSGNLDISHAALKVNLTGIANALPYTIARHGSLTGTFTSVPVGTTVAYFADHIEILAVGTPFQSWIGGYFPGTSDLATTGPDADPDGDGLSNAQEFALGGLPNNGGDRAKVFGLIADSSDTGTAKELMLTIAVLQGTPAFEGTTLPVASFNGYTYKVAGGTDLVSFTSAVSVVTPVTTNLPPAPAGYEYRTFRLDTSVGLLGRGFLKVDVSETVPVP